MAYRSSLHEVGSRRPTGILRQCGREPFPAISRQLPRAQKLRLRRDPGGQLCVDKSERLVGSNRVKGDDRRHYSQCPLLAIAAAQMPTATVTVQP